MHKRKVALLEAPDREWNIIADLLKRGRAPSRSAQDKMRRRAYYFMKKWVRPGQFISDLEDLKRDDPDIFTARCLYGDPTSVRWIIEAGLLTPAPYEEIGDYIGYPASVIDVYEQLFYQVRDRLESRGYIQNMILMPVVAKSLHSQDFDFLYKILGYCSGWRALTSFIDVGEMDANTEGWINSSLRSRLKKLGWMAVHRVEVNQFSALEIIDKCLELQRIEREQGTGNAQDQAATLMKDLLESRSLTIISSKEKLPVTEPRALDGPVEPYDGPYAKPQEVVRHGDGEAQQG